ncbi:MAG: GHKL domain-containing protein [Lachnospiraceae bacterium]|nr:GHKL domain-containing protein [Lachnospiraceae bacterium]
MILDYYWTYFAAFFLSGIIFTLPMEKREGFQKKITLFVLVNTLLGVLILHIPEGNVIVQEAVFMALGCALQVIMLRTCWEISWSVAVYNMVWGVSLWEIVVEGASMLLTLRRGVRPEAVGEQLIILGAYAITFSICLCTIAKWMPEGRKERLGPRQMSLTILLFAIINMLSFHEAIDGVSTLPYQWGYFYLTQMICIVVLYLESELFKKSQLKQEKEILDLLYKTQQEQYKLSKENIALINQKCHDLKHQIRALRTANKEELDKYLGEIEDSVQIYEAIVKTGNDVFDTILTEKSLYCKKHGIQVTCVADGSQLGFIDTIDLYAILGNAMDNAIEAVEKFKEKEKRQIDVMIYRQHNFLVMNIINPIPEQLIYEEDIPVTTKKDKLSHGFGLRSIRQILKKYEGFLNVSEEDGCFSLKMLIPIQLVK